MTGSRALIIGIGGGSRLAENTYGMLDADCLIVSTDAADTAYPHPHIRILCDNMVNPSVESIRASSQEAMDSLYKVMVEYDTVIVLANLAGRTGAAIAPLITEMGHKLQNTVISFCIMPFRFEKDRIFNAGVSLHKVQANSNSLIILDNDSLLECNPNLTIDECYRVGNNALESVLASFGRAQLSGQSVVATGPERNDADESLHSAIKMLYATAPPNSVKRSIIYVSGNIPVGTVEEISKLTAGVTDASVEIVTEHDDTGVMLVSALSTLGKFEAYDPLSDIPIKLDDEYPDGVGVKLFTDTELYNVE